MIKKIAALSLSLIMTIGLFAGCSKTPESDVKEPTANEEISQETEDTTVPEETIGADENIAQTFTIFTVLEIQDDYIIVEPMSVDPVWGGVSTIKVPLDGTIDWVDRQVGDMVNVGYYEKVVNGDASEIGGVSTITFVSRMGEVVDTETETTPPADDIEVKLDDKCVYQYNGINVYLGNGYYGKDGSLCPTVHLINNTDKVLKLRINSFAFDADEKREVEYYSLDVEPGKEHIMDLQHEFEAAAKSWGLDVDFETLGVVTFSLSVIDATDKNSENIWGSEAIETFDALTIDWSYGQVWYF